MKRFNLIIATASALLLSLVLAASVAAASNPAPAHGPTNLTGELCGDAVCFEWTPGTADYWDFNEVQVWEGREGPAGDGYYGGMTVDVDGQARIPISYLFIKEPQSSGDTVEFAFRVLVIKLVNGGHAVGDAAKSNLVVVEVPRPGS